MVWLWIILALVFAVLAYVRLAPIDADKEHVLINATEDADGEGHCIRVIDARPDALELIDAAALALPRTKRIAGSVVQGRMTYVTRSKGIGFPDFTTVQQDGAQIRMFGRLRFGRSDFNVNRARLEHLARAAKG